MGEITSFFNKWKWRIYIGLSLLAVFIFFFFIVLIIAIFMALSGASDNSQDGGCTDNTTSDIGNVATSQNKTKNAQSLFNGLIKMGATKEAAAAFLGVWDFESDFNPNTVNSSGYTGLAQWGGGRLDALNSFAKGDSKTLKGQLGFVQHELQTTYKSVSGVLKSHDVNKAVETITEDYEGLKNYPDQWHYTTQAGGHIGRKDSAKQWYAKFAGNSGGIANQGQTSDNIDNDTSSGTESDCNDADTSVSAGDFVWPFETKVPPQTGQKFGMRILNNAPQWHDGWDIGETGQSIHAVHNGKVIFAGDPATRGIDDSFPNGLGKLVIVTKAADGIEIVYQEFDLSGKPPMVHVGDKIKAGQIIGRLTTDHLHIGFTRKDWVKAQADAFTPHKTWLDPSNFLSGKRVKVPKNK